MSSMYTSPRDLGRFGDLGLAEMVHVEVGLVRLGPALEGTFGGLGEEDLQGSRATQSRRWTCTVCFSNREVGSVWLAVVGQL
jgi:hypothetical protein